MTAALATLLLDSRLRITMGDALPLPVLDGFPIKSGQVHEWFLSGDFPAGGWWAPPLTVMSALAFRGSQPAQGKHRVVWIGRKCWPTFQLPCALNSDETAGTALRHSVFLDPENDAERFWVIGRALRCAGVRAVVADGSRMTPTISRRLQLAAESAMVLGLISRPPWEAAEPSCAATRWKVRPSDTQGKSGGEWGGQAPGWSIELLSCRGQRAGQDAPQNWNADWNYQVFRGSGALHFSSVVGRGVDASPVRGAQARPRTA